ncbi:8850_t:CDS:2, partial [Gigaspora rosea]
LRINLAWSLVEELLEMNEKLHTRKNKAKIQSELHNQSSEKKSVYVTKKFDLPIARLQPQSHYPEWREERGSCIWCRFQYMSEHGRHDKNSPQSYMWCTAKTIGRDMKDDHSLNNNRVEESTYSKATTSSLGLQSLEMPIGAMEMTSNINYVNSFSEPIYSNIIDTTNKPLIDRLKIECDYTWHPITNKATKYIDELIDNYDTRNKFHSKLQLPFVLPNKTTYLLVNTMKYIGLINLLTN